MKKKGILALLGACVALLIGVFVVSCDRMSQRNATETDDPVAQVAQEFTNVGEAVAFQTCVQEQYVIDSLFRTMPKQTLHQVATVLINKQPLGVFTVKDIVDEFRQHKDVYNNLSPEQPAPKSEAKSEQADNSQPTSTEGMQTEVGKVSYNIQDTVINGKKAEIITKTEIHYE